MNFRPIAAGEVGTPPMKRYYQYPLDMLSLKVNRNGLFTEK